MTGARTGTPSARPAQRDPLLLGLVFVGGTAGTCVRALLEDAVPAAPGGWPWATFAINLSGALVLGVLLAVLARGGSDQGWRRRVRLGAGTGFLGGYTTYSTFAVEITRLAWPTAIGYSLATVLLGALAAWLGAAAVRRIPRGRSAP